ncbi:MAG: ABC transporter permease [Treponema sp.]|nr:ABC transporter permease [Treponema sp.]
MKSNRRFSTLVFLISSLSILIILLLIGIILPQSTVDINLSDIKQAPSAHHIFGTDWLGRDMLCRTLKGLSVSMEVGIITAVASCVIAVILGASAAYFGGKVDSVIKWLTDVTMGMPMTIFLIMISVLVGKGKKGIILGVVLTHWVHLARIIRVEVMQIRNRQYIAQSRSFGKSGFYILKNHILPAILPQFIVGVVLLFPHAILHEAAITFLGFGIPPDQPAIGIILSEAMGYLNTGMWWLAVFPGVVLVIIVRIFDKLGERLNYMLNPTTGQQ